MILLGSITIPVGPWLWLIMLVFTAAVVLLFWSYRQSVELGAIHKTAFCLKLLGMLVLLLCLIEPLWSGKRA